MWLEKRNQGFTAAAESYAEIGEGLDGTILFLEQRTLILRLQQYRTEDRDEVKCAQSSPFLLSITLCS